MCPFDRRRRDSTEQHVIVLLYNRTERSSHRARPGSDLPSMRKPGTMDRSSSFNRSMFAEQPLTLSAYPLPKRFFRRCKLPRHMNWPAFMIPISGKDENISQLSSRAHAHGHGDRYSRVHNASHSSILNGSEQQCIDRSINQSSRCSRSHL